MKPFFYLFIALLAFGLSSCTDSENNEISLDNLVQGEKVIANDVELSLYYRDSLQVGYNEVFFDLTKGNEALESPEVTMTPIMHMETMSHSSPVWQPDFTRNEEFDLFKGAFIATMPSGMMGNWELKFIIKENPEAEALELVVPIYANTTSQVRTFVGPDEARYILTWIAPTAPQVGENDLRVALHKFQTMMSFPPVTDASISIEPWMPSMNHGSANNVNPTYNGNGEYVGKVNFNMTGDWEVRFTIEKDAAPFFNHAFELTF